MRRNCSGCTATAAAPEKRTCCRSCLRRASSAAAHGIRRSGRLAASAGLATVAVAWQEGVRDTAMRSLASFAAGEGMRAAVAEDGCMMLVRVPASAAAETSGRTSWWWW